MCKYVNNKINTLKRSFSFNCTRCSPFKFRDSTFQSVTELIQCTSIYTNLAMESILFEVKLGCSLGISRIVEIRPELGIWAEGETEATSGKPELVEITFCNFIWSDKEHRVTLSGIVPGFSLFHFCCVF